ncbi:MAG: hypothetical protein OJF50_003934 [Nitrospira sp.]|jgi:hypothetical protein|nr:hypothetical protein [Nitrospira sp.]
MRHVVTLALLAAMSVGWSGCSIYREHSFDNKHESAIVDSKQRSIVAIGDKDKDNPKHTIVCSEPSPDTFSAIGHALSASSAFSPVTKEVSLALSLALAESAGTIQRARSVQLLRDGLYAACLGFANGLSVEQYNRLLVRQLSAAAVFLAIEQLTPQAVPSSITLNAGDASLKKEPTPTGKSGEKSDEKSKTPQPEKEKTPPIGDNTSGNTPPPGGKTNDKKQSDRLGAGNEESSFFRVLVADSPAVTTPKKEDPSKDETPKKEEPTKNETPKKEGSPTGTNTNSQALPPPTPEAVQAIQYIVSLYLHDAMVFECLDQVRSISLGGKTLIETNPGNETPAGQLLEACIANVKALAYRGSMDGPVLTPKNGDKGRPLLPQSFIPEPSTLQPRPVPAPFQVK